MSKTSCSLRPCVWIKHKGAPSNYIGSSFIWHLLPLSLHVFHHRMKSCGESSILSPRTKASPDLGLRFPGGSVFKLSFHRGIWLVQSSEKLFLIGSGLQIWMTFESPPRQMSNRSPTVSFVFDWKESKSCSPLGKLEGIWAFVPELQ